MIKNVLYFLVVLVGFWSCKAEKIQVPSYVQIDTYSTKVSSQGLQGTNDEKFTDMLVYGNEQGYGTFPVGKPVPVLASGPTKLSIRGVIEVNGVSALRADYEVMQACDTIINLTPGKVTKVSPVFEYYAGTQFPIREDFETSGSGYFLNANGTSDTTARLSSPGYNSAHCLELLPNASVISNVKTKSAWGLPGGSVGVYLEFEYMGNTAIRFTINGTTSNTNLDLGGVYPSASWNKVYLNLTEQVTSLHANGNNTQFIIIIYAVYDSSVGDNHAFIDNIKLVSQQ